ncbi:MULTISPECIES: helix-turn-helix domain-containing protein [Acinetobacter calcoaceticus/baumannii complex]|uniref:helix-turn-helix domain-containing protein n=1 Tax=Acinetobacter calcoaceticus/baumannii complex TaxID=909768 RepID=UPI001D179B35|nr:MULTISPECIES: helix-turn-helix domain-containing protein [Acinetobacter calcoaceticus/baumannii complex]MCW8536498.1 helix-turn-helix domain containing protein [Acinetobacter baumannii]MCW8540284.1 helix-turn-helix domain containing protein [Acinetobacter baumannii]MCW8547565.1 helix-turn-helix domain containing protein [Acinetobacter baumannii]MCW8551314.1 helix-turn-helix domain containing protein [Acinetobacter baumannii]MCW8562180.1 helix-turn-helix domain containing protein [Acinetobac
MNSINERLRSEVERIGVSKLARDLGIARNTLYNWCEKGNIPLDKLLILSDYGLDVSYIITGQKMVTAINPEAAIVAQKYEQANAEIKNKVLMLLLSGEDATKNVVTEISNTGNGTQYNAKKQTVNNAPVTQNKTKVKVRKQRGDIVNGDKHVAK